MIHLWWKSSKNKTFGAFLCLLLHHILWVLIQNWNYPTYSLFTQRIIQWVCSFVVSSFFVRHWFRYHNTISHFSWDRVITGKINDIQTHSVELPEHPQKNLFAIFEIKKSQTRQLLLNLICTSLHWTCAYYCASSPVDHTTEKTISNSVRRCT